MNVELITKDLQNLVKGVSPHYSQFDNPLVKKAGHEYSDQYGITYWYKLDSLSDQELWDLYHICKSSWK